VVVAQLSRQIEHHLLVLADPYAENKRTQARRSPSKPGEYSQLPLSGELSDAVRGDGNGRIVLADRHSHYVSVRRAAYDVKTIRPAIAMVATLQQSKRGCQVGLVVKRR
jgi:hypothetical protein